MKKLSTFALLCLSFASYAQLPKVLTSLDSVFKPKETIALDLSNQKFKEIPKEIFTFSNLKSLDLSGNDIKVVPGDIKKTKLTGSA